MAVITFPGMTLTGDHASRPAAADVGSGTLYACSTHSLVYQSDGSSWATWFTGGSSTSYASNVNAVGEANAGGAASTLTRGDHVHLGVRSVAHASNTFSGPVTLTASGGMGITSPTPGTYNLSAPVPSAGGGGGSGSAVPLAVMRYAPGSDTTIGTIASSTQGDVDATNAKITFTAPASGKVIVRVACPGNTSTNGNCFLGLRESTSNIAGPALVLSTSGVSMAVREFYLTGVSAGSHTYKAAFSTSSGTFSLYGGPTYGSIEMTVWEAV